MLTAEKEAALLEKAKAEENEYNWIKAAMIYEQLAEHYLNNNLTEKAAGTYKMLGYASEWGARSVDTAKEYLEQCNRAINAYKKAMNLFKQLGNIAKELECNAKAFYVNGYIAGPHMETKKVLNKSIELSIKSSELYSTEDDRESYARILSCASIALMLLSDCSSDQRELKQVVQRCKDISNKAWMISKEIGNIQYLAEALLAEVMINRLGRGTLSWDDTWKKYAKKIALKCGESLRLAESSNDFRVLSTIYTATGIWYAYFEPKSVDNVKEKRKLVDEGLGLIEKGLNFAEKANDKFMIIRSTYYLLRFAFDEGRVDYIEKRRQSDFRVLRKLEKIYKGFILNNLAKVFLCDYYMVLAIDERYSPIQRKIYAKKGIKHAKEALKMGGGGSVRACLYLTILTGRLTTLATTKDERDENTKKMLHYAKLTEDLCKNYDGALPGFVACNVIYVSHWRLAEMAESDDEKIKMLTIAVNANEKLIKYTIDLQENQTWVAFANKNRLGILYEQLGILTKNNDTLRKAREIFLSVINDSFESEYMGFRDFAYVHIAHIEDRLGNYTASAENYKKAVETYTESLKHIEYKPLKNRIKERIEYFRAWNLIESAKTYHKRENHLKAKESYVKASKILENLLSYSYEAPYFAAWASLEEAEQLSKQERQEEAIERYKTTQIIFENAIKTLEKASTQLQKEERERIEKLKKVVKIRINYCSARINLENARILGKKGEHIEAAENFALAASQFRRVCTVFKIEHERKELEAIYYLCRAWESMELGEKYEEPNRFEEAANLFTKASNLFADTKLKLLSSGNSSFCQALEYGCKFDESIETEIKSHLYQKVKLMLRKAADSYRKGGFKSGADWALATSTYFDATWNLIRADEELNLEEKGNLLGICSRCLKSAAELFAKAGHKDKEKDVQEQLEMVEREEIIILTALNTIKEPSISRSTTGIIAPACPLETSQPPSMNEIREIAVEARRVLAARKPIEKAKDLLKTKEELEKTESEVDIEEREYFCIVHKGPIIGANYLCPSCRTFYCVRCAQALKEKGEKCWACNQEIKL